MLFAPRFEAMIIWGLMFFSWALVAGVIVHKQGRMFPVLIAHWIINLPFAVMLPVMSMIA